MTYIPTFTKQQFVDPKTGELTAPKQVFFDTLFQQMQNTLSDDGLVAPSLKTDQINQIASASNNRARPNGTFWYDEQTNQMKVKVNNVVRIVALV